MSATWRLIFFFYLNFCRKKCLNTKFQAADATLRMRQKDLGIIPHSLSTSLDDLERASNHLLSAVNDLEEGPVKERIVAAHREVTQVSTHP